MTVQKQFEKFNDNIRVDFDTNHELKEKREVLVNILRNSDDLPSFEVINQGSYILKTGIKPEEDQEYDIDVGLIFSVNKDDYKPLELKEKICSILENHTDYGAKIKKPCVTVTYKKNNKAAFHIDLVVYAYENNENKESQLYIAKGVSGNEDSIKWEKADPKGLVDYINNTIVKGEQRDQFRRIIRYIKKWRNRRFSNFGHISPASIGLTLMTIDNFSYNSNDDLRTLIDLVHYINNKFDYAGRENGRDLYRIELSLPYQLSFDFPNDVFEKMTDNQMTDFKDKITKFSNDLEEARNEIDEYDQYKKLNKIFGDDFEIPEEKNTAKNQINYIPSSSSSGLEIY